MLKNHTYTGTRYFNRMTVVRDISADGTRPTTKRPRLVYRDRDEWIAVSVPAIVSRELFNQVQERLRVVASPLSRTVHTVVLEWVCALCNLRPLVRLQVFLPQVSSPHRRDIRAPPRSVSMH
jgi:hypothetical protein